MKKLAHIAVFGKVQGVFFRYNAKQKALALNVAGFVENKLDGSVYIEAQGEEEQLKKFVAWCHEGSPFARVDLIRVEFVDHLENIDSFEIHWGKKS